MRLLNLQLRPPVNVSDSECGVSAFSFGVPMLFVQPLELFPFSPLLPRDVSVALIFFQRSHILLPLFTNVRMCVCVRERERVLEKVCVRECVCLCKRDYV